MYKTSVYLTPEQDESLRSAAARTGRSRAELIREGIRLVTGGDEGTSRKFHSLGQGHGDGAPCRRWDADDIYRRKVAGRR